MSSREAAGHGSRSGHHGAGSRGHESVRDRQRASVPGDRGTDRRDSDASPRLRAAEAPAEPRTRPGRSKRSDDSADWPSTEWDKLSDVDYWAELASDKPLTTTAQPPATPRPGQAGLEHDAQAGADRSAVTGHGPTSGHGAAGGVAPGSLGDPALPVRRRPELAAAPVPLPPPAPAQPRPAAAAGYYPDDPTIDQGGDARHGRRRIADSLADDPLTSPSFPRVRADDSRSFRSSRASGSAASREAAQNAPTQQFASYQSPAAPYGPPSAAALEREPRPAYPDSYPAGSGAHSRPPSGAVPAAGGPSSTGAAPSPSGNPYGSYVGNPVGDAFSSRSAADLNGHRSAPYPATGDHNGQRTAPYPAAGDLNSQRSANSHRSAAYPPAEDLNGHRSAAYPPADDVNGHRSAAYPPADDVNGHRSAPYPAAQELSRHRSDVYPLADDRDARGREWYPQSADSPLTRNGDERTMPGTGRFDAPGTGRRGGDGPYYPADYLPGEYPAARPSQDGYLPPADYPGAAPPASHTQDPYAPDGYGRRPRY